MYALGTRIGTFIKRRCTVKDVLDIQHNSCLVASRVNSDHHMCLISLRLPNAFALNSTHSMATAVSASEAINSPVETDTLKIEEVQAPATGTRKAKVLYDYDAADSSELSLLADEVSFHPNLSGFRSKQ